MLRTERSGPDSSHLASPPIFDLRREHDFGAGCRLRCVLVPHNGTVEVVINTAHGWASYDHAAYHAHQPGLKPMACLVGEPCGYAGGSPPPE